MLPSVSMFHSLPPPYHTPPRPCSPPVRRLSDLQGSWELQDPQGSSPYTLGSSPLRRLRPWAGHGDSKQRTGSVEERVRVGSGQMPKSRRRGGGCQVPCCPHLPSPVVACKYSSEAALESDTSTSLASSTTLEEREAELSSKQQSSV